MDSLKRLGISLLLVATILGFISALPDDPIFFQNLILDRPIFDNFLISYANLARAPVKCCLPPMPPNPNITGPPMPSTDNGENDTMLFKSLDFYQSSIPPAFWVVGDCSNDFQVEEVIRRVIGARKYIMLWVNELCDTFWDILYDQVKEKPSILIYWNIASGPGVGSPDLMPLTVPENTIGLETVVLGFLEGLAIDDNDDDRYWDYHFDQMFNLMSTYPLTNITTKLVAFNGLYLSRSLAETVGNCSQANGYFHYINNKDIIRLMPRFYRQKLEQYGFKKTYNIWGVSEFFRPDFKGASSVLEYRTFWIVVLVLCCLQ